MTAPPRSWAEISPAALAANFAAVRSLLPAGTAIMAVVKANAYGHGALTAVRTLAGSAQFFGVASVREALEIEPLAKGTPIFLLSPSLPEERPVAADHGFIPSLSTLEEARAFSALGEKRGQPLPAHLVLDTGMGRIGVWEDEAEPLAAEIARLPGITVTGLASHLPVADEDFEFSQRQLSRFHELASHLRTAHFPGALLHVDNSAGVIGFAHAAGDLVRPGLMLYGSSPLPEFQARLRPVLTWKTRITLLREVGPGRGVSYGRTYITSQPMRLATLGVGYADGFRRHLSGKGADVLIGGRRCVVLGRVTMDQIVVDVTAVPGVQVGDEAVLLGQQGDQEILAAEMAERAGTIAWDIFTGLGRRVERVEVTT